MVSTRFYQNKPPTILDVPVDMQWEALNIPELRRRQSARAGSASPRGRRVRLHLERSFGCARRRDLSPRPVNLDTILTSLEAGRPMQHPLTAHI